MFTPGSLKSRKTTPHPYRAVARGKAVVARRPPLSPTLRTRDTRQLQVRHYASEYGGNPGLAEMRAPEQPQRRWTTPPLIQARPAGTSAPLSPNVPPKPEPFDKLTQALFETLYDKLPLDHAKYTKVLEVPNDYAVLSSGDIYVLALRYPVSNSKKLTFPLNPADATKILACGNERENHVRDLRMNMASHYIFSLEGVDEMRTMLDPDYRPLSERR